MKKILGTATLTMAAALALAACGSAPEEQTTSAGSETSSGSETASGGAAAGGAAAGDTVACMVSDQGGFDDRSFNQSGAEGLDAAVAEFGIEEIKVESQSDADYTTNVDSLISQGCTLIIGVGYLLENAIEEGAVANPDVNFALIDSTFSDEQFNEVVLDNARPLIFNTAEAAFLAGYAAAGMSQSGTVATFGGLQVPSVSVFMDGFVLGVEAFNEDTGGDVQTLGWDVEAQTGSFSGDFENQAAGQVLAEQFIAQGADVIMPVAGPVGLGAAAAAEAADGVMIVGVDADWYESTDYGPIVLTSVVKEIGASVHETVEDEVEGEFTNEPYVGTLENGGVSLAPFHDFEDDVPAELADRLAELEQEIASGARTVESPNSP